MRSTTRLALAAVIALASSLLVATAPVSSKPEGLGIRRAPGRLRGTYIWQGHRTVFSAERHGNERTVARVVVDGIRFDASYDPTRPAVRLDGHGRKLPVAQREVLRNLVGELERRWDPYRRPLAVEERLAFRLLLLLSDAPAGFVFDEMTIEAPVAPMHDPDFAATDTFAVLVPAGGEVWAKGTVQTIRWRAPSSVETVDLHLWHEVVCVTAPCPQRPSVLYPLARGVENSGRYAWEVPSLLPEIGLPPSGRYYVRVSDPVTGRFADAAAPFLMVPARGARSGTAPIRRRAAPGPPPAPAPGRRSCTSRCPRPSSGTRRRPP